MWLKLFLMFNSESKSMSTEKKNIWTVIINTILTLISGIASAYGLGGF